MHGNALAKITLCVFVWLWLVSLFASSSTLDRKEIAETYTLTDV